jgi:hypothetical protein
MELTHGLDDEVGRHVLDQIAVRPGLRRLELSSPSEQSVRSGREQQWPDVESLHHQVASNSDAQLSTAGRRRFQHIAPQTG